MQVFMLGFVEGLGGYETQMLRLSKALEKKQVDASIVTFDRGWKQGKMPGNMAKIYRLPSLKGSYIFTLSAILPVLAFFAPREKKPLLHAHHPDYGLMGAIVKTAFGGKLIVKVPASKMYFGPLMNRKWNTALFRLMSGKTDMFIALNTDSINELLNLGVQEDKITFIPNGIDCNEFRPAKAKKIKNSAIFAGRLDRQKRPDILLKAWKLVTEKFPDAKLTIYGGTEKNLQARKMVEELGVEKNVKIIHGRRIKPEDYNKHQVYVSTSDYEGMSNSLLEAMACQMPIIATDITGVTEIIENKKNGMIVETGNPQQTAKAIKKLFTNKKLAEKIAKNARKKAKEMDILKIAEKYKELYEKLVE